ncbi:MAG TPA: hypothetical protein VIS48_12870 [Candidatus Kryptonia bacterium]
MGPHNGGGADTTSHNWTFTIDTLGDGASDLYDVAIVSTNPPVAYAVGEINVLDSVGNWENPFYNLAGWDGGNWSLQRVPYYYQGQPYYHPIQSVFSFGPREIWLCGNGVIYWDGSTFAPVPVPTAVWGQYQMNKIWGTGSSNIYVVGNGGSAAMYTSGSWQKVISNITLDIRDIWGSPDGSQILAVASNDEGSKFLSIQGTTVTTVSDSGLGSSLYGVWFVPNQKYYAVGAGISWKHRLTDRVWNTYAPGVVTSYVSESVAGNDTSDVFVVGDSFEMVHYNGRSWHNYKDMIPLSYGVLGKVAIKGNLMIAVGFTGIGQKAIAVIGRRQN